MLTPASLAVLQALLKLVRQVNASSVQQLLEPPLLQASEDIIKLHGGSTNRVKKSIVPDRWQLQGEQHLELHCEQLWLAAAMATSALCTVLCFSC